MAGVAYDGIKIFSATRAAEREKLGEKMEGWSRVNQHLDVVEARVLQSSDNAYHCLTIAVFWKRR